jgi:diketogulonate reductase-like aldo/keto reductase
MPSSNPFHPSRRTVLKAAGAGALLGAGATVASTPTATAANAGEAVPATPAPPVMTRPIPRTGESVPVVGMGTFMTFDKRPGAPRDHLREVLRRFWDGGARVLDTSPLYGYSEITVGDFATELGINRDLFLTNKTWATGEYLSDDSHAVRQLEQSYGRLWRDQLDVMQVHSLTNAEMIVPILRRWKEEGRIRYVGVTHHVLSYFPALEQWIRDGDLDFIQVSYSIRNRLAEERILPAAIEHGTAVMVNMPMEKGRMHAVIGDRPLPDFAAEIGCRTWGQFFLKYVLAHPGVTCVLPATANPDHMSENLEVMQGDLPDEAMRRRMVEHVEAIPGFADVLSMPWYPGRTFDGMVRL